MGTLFNKRITVIPRQGVWEKGVWEISEGAPFVIRGSVQPTTGHYFDTILAGRQDSGNMTCYSSIKLNVTQEQTNNAGDYVVYAGRVWECVSEMPFLNGILPHYEYLVMERGAYNG